ncbi:unnamed protein product [Peniophora sp. CBMAI 1063]|nr:unnamed protein product [Peniophora sp. CBMAI 1063]
MAAPVEVYRVLRVLVNEKPFPLTGLRGSDFLKAFLDIILCHYIAWARAKVYHHDLTLKDAMYRRFGGKIYGVLIDFNLATTDNSGHSGLERTGTAPYMALELLWAATQRETHIAKHLYRQDLEAFYWTLIWVCNCVGGDGKEIVGPLFRSFRTGDYLDCYNGKNASTRLRKREQAILVLPIRRPLWVIAQAWTEDLEDRVRRGERKAEGWDDPFEPDPQESWRKFCGILQSNEVKSGLEANGEEGKNMLKVVDDFLELAKRYSITGR